MTKHMLEIGKPIPDELREAIKEGSGFADWAVICAQEGSKISAYSVRDIVRGGNVGENSITTVEKVIRFSIASLDIAITRKEKFKRVLNTYNRLNQITA